MRWAYSAITLISQTLRETGREILTKVLHVLPALEGGGVEEDTCALILYLKRETDIEPIVASAGGKMVARLEKAGITHHTMPLDRKNPIAFWRNAQALAQLCLRECIDLVHVHSRGPAWSCHKVVRQLNIPLVTTFHGAYGASNALKRYYNRIMLASDATIAISPFIERHIMQTYSRPKRLETITRGVDTTFFNLKCIDQSDTQAYREQLRLIGKRVLLMPGRLSPIKGHIEVFQALASVVSVHKDVCLVCPGLIKESRYIDTLRRIIAKHQLEEHVRLTNYVSDLRPLYALAEWTLVCTRKPEGFGLIMAESSAMETPVITFNWGGAPDLIRHHLTGLLTTQKGLVHGLFEALAINNDARTNLGKQARLHIVDNYNISSCHAKTYQLYGSLLTKEKFNFSQKPSKVG